MRTEDGNLYVNLPPDIFANTDEELEQMRERAKKEFKKRVGFRAKK